MENFTGIRFPFEAAYAIINRIIFPMKPKPSHIFLLGAICTAVCVCFFPSLSNQFVPLDDPGHLLENPNVLTLRLDNLVRIFGAIIDGVYIPLTVLSFAIEHHFFGFHPFVYHLDNLLLHLTVIGLLFYLGKKLGLSALGAGAGALVFGIHPMHVESVAWVTERKDVLYAFFYLLSLHQYWNYLTRNDKRAFALSLLFGLLSMLAKPMALSLPLVLFIFDWFYGRTPRFTSIMEKLAYGAYIIPLTWMTLQHHPYHPINNFHDIILTGIWSLMFYIQKLFYPATLSALYELPQPISLTNPEYLGTGVLLILYLICIFRYRRQRWFLFANLYFISSIFFLIRPHPGKHLHIVADRFTYLPMLGFCLWAGSLVEQHLHHCPKKVYPLRMTILVTIVAALGIKTYTQTRIWKNDESLLNHMVQNTFSNPLPYFARGKMYQDRGDYASAILDYSKAIALGPNWSRAYNNRGIVYMRIGDDTTALNDFNTAISINPTNAQFYNNRGLIHFYLKHDHKALADFNRSIKLNPNAASTYINRARLHYHMKQFHLAHEDLTTALRHDPSMLTQEVQSMLREIAGAFRDTTPSP